MALIGWWKLDGNANDSSGNGYNGTPTNVTWSSGKIATAGSFDGNSYINVPDLTDWVLNKSQYSMSVWAKTPAISASHRHIVGWRSAGAITGFYILHLQNSNLLEVRYLNNSVVTDFTPDVSAYYGQWMHLVFVRDVSSISLYINGTLYGTTAISGLLTMTTAPFAIGKHPTMSDYYYNGLVDDVRIYDHALSQKEVEELSRAKVLHYDFNQFEEYTENLYDGNNTSLGGTLSDIGNGWYSLLFDGSQNGYRFFAPLAKLTNGATYTCSVEVMNQSATNIAVILDWCDLGNVSNTILPGERKIISLTTSRGTYDVTFRFFDICGTASSSILIRNIQIEQKDYATPYVKYGTIRAGTVLDKSGYGNNATLTATSPKWIDKDDLGNGSYYFDGTDAIAVPASSVFDNLSVFTLSAWVKTNDATTDYNHILSKGETGATVSMQYILYIASGLARILIANGTSIYAATMGSVSDGVWHLVTGTYDGTYLRAYLDGVLTSTVTPTLTPLSNNKKVVLGSNGVATPGETLTGYIDDVRIYATALSDADVLELYQTKASVSHDYKLFTDQVIETEKFYTPSQIDYSTWILGSSGSQSGFTQNGTVLENKIIKYPNPNNVDDIVWASLTNDATSDNDGGWDGSSFNIDKTKKYRYSVWVRRENMGTGSGAFYFGCLANSVFDLGGTSKNNNPYFYSSLSTNINDKWILFVAYIHPDGYSGSTDSTSGGYDPLTKRKTISITTDFKWASDATAGNLRTYLFYSTKTNERQFFYRPRVDIVDGTEPTIQELLELRENPNLLTSLLPSNSIPWVLTNVSKDNTTGGFYKSGGTNGVWDAQVYSKIGYTGGAYLRFRINQTNILFMVGLNQDPTTDASYTSIDYAWYQSEPTNKYWYESGVAQGSPRTSYFPVGTILEIWYDNNNIYYYQDGTLARTVSSIGSNKTFYIDSSFYETTTSAEFNEIYFGPTRIPLNLDKYGDFRTSEINEIGIPENPLFFYNFDTIPQIPDNVAGTNYIWDKTTTDGWGTGNGGTLTASNGTLKCTGTNYITGNKAIGTLPRIIKIRARVLSTPTDLKFDLSGGGTVILGSIGTTFTWYTLSVPAGSTSLVNIFRGNYATVSDTLEVSDIYIGNGSYSSKVIDGSCNINNAVISGPVSVYEYNGGQAIKTVSGSSYLSIDGIPDFSGKSFSMGGWFKKDSGKPTTGLQRLFGRGSYDSSTSFAVYHDNSLGFYYRGVGGSLFPGQAYTDGTWVHMVAVINKTDNNLYFYWNGVFKSSSSMAGITVQNSADYIYTSNGQILGGNGPNGIIVCHYDDLFLYPTALNAAEVKALYDKKPSNFKIMDNMNIQTTELIES